MFQGIDRFLATILVAISLIVLVAIVLVWRSPAGRELEYSPDSNPQDVVHNFIVAVTKGNEERGKSYLSAEVLADIEKREKEDGYSLISPRSRERSTGLRVAVDEANVLRMGWQRSASRLPVSIQHRRQAGYSAYLMTISTPMALKCGCASLTARG